MGIIVFVFGLPGSGKSTAARHITSFAKQEKFRPRRYRDYPILYKMFQDEQKANTEKKRFSSTLYDGFDVLNFDVLDEALQTLHRRILRRKKLANESIELLIIEFSRDNYYKALSFFPSLQLRDAHFLFITSDIVTCKTRIKARVNHPRTLDDRYISDYIFETYYHPDHQQHITQEALQLLSQFGVPREHIHLIYNGPEVSVQQFYQAVESIASDILKIKV